MNQLAIILSMVVMKPQFGRVSGLNGGVDTIKQAPPRIDSGIATTIPSRIAARCLWLANLSAMGTSVRFARFFKLFHEVHVESSLLVEYIISW